MKVLLASASPRRRELLKKIFNEFDAATYPADENYKGATPEATVKEIALRKLAAVPDPERYDIVIASDTLVYADGKYYGKPHDEEEAGAMLAELSGRAHEVYSAVAVNYRGKVAVAVDSTKVVFRDLTEDDIACYVNDYECLDKAGAYAIQDGVTVERYVGSYDNVVGLPTEKLRSLLDGMIGDDRNAKD